MITRLGFCLIGLALAGALPASGEDQGFKSLFPEEGVPKGWLVRQWDDVSKPAAEGVTWKVENGVLHGSTQRGTWLVSEKEYGDFVLEFEWKLDEQGNSGCGLRFPLQGDPAFDGMELQMVDPRYFGTGRPRPFELSGGLYRTVAPKVQVFKPTEWNKYQITCKGALLTTVLNGQTILDVNLSEQNTPAKRHNGTDAPPLKERPRKGHIGFQELSRGGGHVQIRNARIKVLE